MAGRLHNADLGQALRRLTDGRVRIQAPALLASAPERSWRQLPSLTVLCGELQAGLDKSHGEAEAVCRELAGKPRRIPLIVFLASFVPEAADY